MAEARELCCTHGSSRNRAKLQNIQLSFPQISWNLLARPLGKTAPGVLSSANEISAGGGARDIIDKAGCG